MCKTAGTRSTAPLRPTESISHCGKLGIAFLPYSPFGGASHAKSLSKVGSLGREARARGVSPHRLVVAWMLAKSPVVIGIPGARRAESITDDAQAAAITLSQDDVRAIEASFS